VSTQECGICRTVLSLSLSGDWEKRTDRYLYIETSGTIEFEKPNFAIGRV